MFLHVLQKYTDNIYPDDLLTDTIILVVNNILYLFFTTITPLHYDLPIIVYLKLYYYQFFDQI